MNPEAGGQREEDPQAKQERTLARRAGKFTFATLVSRVLGFARDALVAHFFGGEYLTDAFYTAFRISNLLRGLLAEGAMSSSFIPVFSHALKHEKKEEVQKFLNAAFTAMSFVLVVIIVAGIIFARPLTNIVTPGFAENPEKFEMTVQLTRWIFPFFLFICLAALLGGVLNSLKHFFLPAFAPAMLSITQIAYLLCFRHGMSQDAQIVGLAIAVVAGGAAHFLMQLPPLFKDGFTLGWRWEWGNPRLVQAAKLLLPAIIGLSVDQINGFVDTICASYLVRGSVSALYNSNRLMQLPLALFGISIASVALPSMADLTAEKNYGRLWETVTASLRMVVFTVLPACVGLIVLARPIVTLLFQHGQFSPFATMLTTRALQGFSLGLVAYSASKVLASAFYSLHDTKAPVRIAAACMMLNIVLNLALMRPLGVGGLALATSVSSWLNAVWLYVLLRRKVAALAVSELTGDTRLKATVLKTSGACLAMGLFLGGILLASDRIPVLVIVLGGIPAAGLIFLGAAMVFRMEEQKLLLSFFGARRKAPVI